jgi:hypothetical protein
MRRLCPPVGVSVLFGIGLVLILWNNLRAEIA